MAAAQRELRLYEQVFGLRLSKIPSSVSSLVPTGTSGALNIQVRWYGENGDEQWTEVSVRPDPVLGNEVTVRHQARPEAFTGVDVSRLVALIALGRFRRTPTGEDAAALTKN